ncbi:MAG: hypothetical protein KAG91_00250 [Mycoplasmataceae bacterium]|nr:hypothetical protein [Mycoplasmataceae bacterium]
MASFIAFIVFGAILFIATFGAVGMWMAGQKNQSVIKGLLLGAILNIIGLIIIGASSSSDKELVDEMYDRKLITKEEYDKTIEFRIKK